MAEDWFVRSADGERGPFQFSELMDLIHSGRVGAENEVKCTLEGRWIRADSIQSQAAVGAAEVEALRIRQESMAVQQTGEVTRPSRLTLFLEEIRERLEPRIVWPVVIVSGWLLINYFVLQALHPYQAERDYLKQLEWVRDDLQHYKEAGITGAKWEDFADKTLDVVQPIVRRLESNAGAEYPVRQHLLWAGRDCIIPALQEPANLNEELEQRLQQHLNFAASLLEQQPES